MKIKMLFIAFGMLLAFCSKAQDLIYKKSGEIILAKVLEMGLEEIKYKDYNNLSGPTLVIANDQVTKVKFEDGKVQMIVSGMDNPESYAGNKKNALKVDFLSPMFGQTTFAYERSIKPGASYELQLGIVGLGTQNHAPSTSAIGVGGGYTSSGFFLRAGYKFIRSPDYYLRGMKYSHILKGSYIKPEITFGSAVDHVTYYSLSGKIPRDVNYQFSAFMLTFGKQWILGDVFLIDYFVGFGYGVSSKSTSTAYDIFSFTAPFNNHAFYGPFDTSPLSLATGLKIGVLF